MYSQESFPIWSKMKLWDCPPPTPHHQLGILTPDVADGGNNWLPGNLVPGINGSPRATPGRGFLTRHISDGRDPEHRPGGEHPLLLQPSHICQGLGNELPKPISSSKKKKKKLLGKPKKSHCADLGLSHKFPLQTINNGRGWKAAAVHFQLDFYAVLSTSDGEGPAWCSGATQMGVRIPGFHLCVCIKGEGDCVWWPLSLELWCSGMFSTFIKGQFLFCAWARTASVVVLRGCLSEPGHLWEIPDHGKVEARHEGGKEGNAPVWYVRSICWTRTKYLLQ